MRRMAEEFFAASPVLILPVLALVIFMLVFVAACFVAYRIPAGEMNRRARLPLEKEDYRE